MPHILSWHCSLPGPRRLQTHEPLVPITVGSALPGPSLLTAACRPVWSRGDTDWAMGQEGNQSCAHNYPSNTLSNRHGPGSPQRSLRNVGMERVGHGIARVRKSAYRKWRGVWIIYGVFPMIPHSAPKHSLCLQMFVNTHCWVWGTKNRGLYLKPQSEGQDVLITAPNSGTLRRPPFPCLLLTRTTFNYEKARNWLQSVITTVHKDNYPFNAGPIIGADRMSRKPNMFVPSTRLTTRFAIVTQERSWWRRGVEKKVTDERYRDVSGITLKSVLLLRYSTTLILTGASARNTPVPLSFKPRRLWLYVSDTFSESPVETACLRAESVPWLSTADRAVCRVRLEEGRALLWAPWGLSLHRLQLSFRIEFNTLIITLKAQPGLAPGYVTALLTPHEPRRRLRSSGRALPVIPRSRSAKGWPGLSVRAPRLWNGLPEDIGVLF